jgi:hypothetical protein
VTKTVNRWVYPVKMERGDVRNKSGNLEKEDDVIAEKE